MFFPHLLFLLLLLLHHLCLYFHVHFRRANSSPSSSPNFHTQWALQDLNCKGLSALGTAGPQPGTFRAQWAPLDLNLGPSELSEHRDLNLGPSELSEHRWTSTAR